MPRAGTEPLGAVTLLLTSADAPLPALVIGSETLSAYPVGAATFSGALPTESGTVVETAWGTGCVVGAITAGAVGAGELPPPPPPPHATANNAVKKSKPTAEKRNTRLLIKKK